MEMAAPATSVVVLDRGNNTTCTVNLHGKPRHFSPFRDSPVRVSGFPRVRVQGKGEGQELDG